MTDINLKRRRGIVRISNELLNEMMDNSPTTLLKITNGFLVMNVQYDVFNNETLFLGHSINFRIVEEGEAVPTYIVEINRDGMIKFVERGYM